MDQQYAQLPAASEGIPATAIGVITNPVNFYKSMPKTGGFQKPLIFAVVMGVLAGLVQSVLLAIGFKPGAGIVMAVAALIVTPIMVAIFGFVGAGIAWVSWKLMGSNESYETAYRCTSYASAITPLTALAGIVPLIGPSIGMVWMTIIVIIASVEVHQIPKKRAQLVFGGMCAFFVLVSVAGQIAARALKGKLAETMAGNQQVMDQFKQQMNSQNLTPAQQQAMNAVMAQLQQAAQGAQQQQGGAPAPTPAAQPGQ